MEVAERPPRRRRRTAALLTGAAVLGVVAGTCTGYVVQARRPPTRLPSLSQPALKQATGEPEPLTAVQDRQVRTDGDLRKLLLKKPRGARDADFVQGDGWMDVADYAETYDRPAGAFGDLLGAEFRRAAVTAWQAGRTRTVEIRLIQYRQEENLEARDAAENAQTWAERGGARSRPVPGTGTGRAYVHPHPETRAGYLPQYTAEAHAWRGDIVMEMWITDTKPVSKAEIVGLATRQMERL
ncbi:hypothetical protein ACFOOM_13010 [Streptomyces echinoruber]|uniref:Uncharacterized protein n=1 Tax=Streptomyces echinoruber TaxID=68898 RepID=A0A918RTI2_9ACTN|nr:hypothetical protein [Streptomyces echinoruber]GHA09283.1 hypothetical protein GCM10010389_55480 [Streptomyces echinoruber]